MTPVGEAAEEWLGDPSSSGRILVTAHLAGPAPAPGVLARVLDGLGARHAWGSAGVVEDGDHDAALAARHQLVARAEAAPVHVVRTDRALILSAHHAAVDGLGMLALLGALTGGAVSSDARGVGDRPPGRSALVSGLGRSVELLRPPAHLASTTGPTVRRERLRTAPLPSAVGTAALVRATARALDRMPGRRGGRVQVAVGASRRPGRPLGPDEVRDASTWLRIRDPQDLTPREVGDLLRAAAPQPTAGAERGAARGLVTAAVRRMAGRLGSSVLVSHLGTVEASTVPALRSLEFHPLAGGRGGLALGAATVEGTTTLGLRGDAARTPPDTLDELLDRVVEELVEGT